MKILLLSLAGKQGEPEDIKYMNLYLASLKKNVVPYFDTKVILYNNWNIETSENSLLTQRVKEFGLEDVVTVKTINELGLPENSVKWIKPKHWFGRIGMHMNILRDYAKQNQFFGAEWIFHTDTDIEFLPNFNECLTAINGMVPIHPRITIALAGDSYPYQIIHDNKEYLFEEPDRVNFYDSESVTDQTYGTIHRTKLKVTELEEGDYRRNQPKDIFRIASMKIRNDFFGMTRTFADSVALNWVHSNYPYDFQDGGPLQEWWPKESGLPEIHINYDKGGPLQYKLHCGELDVTNIRLPGYSKMSRHYGSGWFNPHFMNQIQELLNSNYSETKSVWENDYKVPEPIVEPVAEPVAPTEQQEPVNDTIGNMTKMELIDLIKAAIKETQ